MSAHAANDVLVELLTVTSCVEMLHHCCAPAHHVHSSIDRNLSLQALLYLSYLNC